MKFYWVYDQPNEKWEFLELEIKRNWSWKLILIKFGKELEGKLRYDLFDLINVNRIKSDILDSMAMKSISFFVFVINSYNFG